MFLLPRPRRDLASALAPMTRRAPLREMAPPRSRRRDQPRASGERRSAAVQHSSFLFRGRDFVVCISAAAAVGGNARTAGTAGNCQELPGTARNCQELRGTGG